MSWFFYLSVFLVVVNVTVIISAFRTNNKMSEEFVMLSVIVHLTSVLAIICSLGFRRMQVDSEEKEHARNQRPSLLC